MVGRFERRDMTIFVRIYCMYCRNPETPARRPSCFSYTQTWSHRAIAMHLGAGFQLIAHESFADHENDYEPAMPR